MRSFSRDRANSPDTHVRGQVPCDQTFQNRVVPPLQCLCMSVRVSAAALVLVWSCLSFCPFGFDISESNCGGLPFTRSSRQFRHHLHDVTSADFRSRELCDGMCMMSPRFTACGVVMLGVLTCLSVWFTDPGGETVFATSLDSCPVCLQEELSCSADNVSVRDCSFTDPDCLAWLNRPPQDLVDVSCIMKVAETVGREHLTDGGEHCPDLAVG